MSTTINKKTKSDAAGPRKVVPVPMNGGFFGMAVGSGTASADLKRSEESLKLLTRRLISAQEEERKRIARELHDDLNQRIAVIAIELELLANAHPSFREAVEPIQRHIEDIGHDIHVMSHQLHPSKLDHLGLVPSIKGLCSEISESRRVRVEFVHHAVPARLGKEVKLCIFRVAQEALQNAARHSGALTINVELRWTNGKLKLNVTDDGGGFVTTTEKMTKGLGITSMEERLRSIDGKLKIISKPGSGTSVEATAPAPRVTSIEN
ncbi:MAG TPA: sensor histidine kinase [Pyrinomonadaceae bacterium]|nr:sensor histidine kinase [Pyrinomonadaceae bacterium]